MKTVTPKLQFLDLSHWTGKVDWDKLSQNKDLIAVGWKASEGNYNTDPTYAAARVEAKKRGYLWLAYHFATSDDVEEQVDRFMEAAKPDDQTRMALDWEDYKKQMSTEQVVEFLSILDARIGRRATLYTGNRGRESLGDAKNEFLGRHPLWVPRYGATLAQQPKVQASWDHWDVWQYAADGNGLEPNSAIGVQEMHPDCNVFYDDVTTVRANWAGAPLTVPTPTPLPDPVVVTITINAPPGVRVNVVQTSGE